MGVWLGEGMVEVKWGLPSVPLAQRKMAGGGCNDQRVLYGVNSGGGSWEGVELYPCITWVTSNNTIITPSLTCSHAYDIN